MLPLALVACEACAVKARADRERAAASRRARDALALALEVDERALDRIRDGDDDDDGDDDARARRWFASAEGRRRTSSARASAKTAATTAMEDEEDDGDEDGDEAARPSCRFCFEPRGDLVSPCACAGTAAFVHVHCLRRWQRVSLRTHGVEENACRVCGETFALAKAPAAARLAQWFSPCAHDRVEQYAKFALRTVLNTVLGGDDAETLTRPRQLVPVVSANEARIWANREIRKGNRFFRSLATFSHACEWTHSLFVFLYLGAGLSEIGIDLMASAAVTAEPEMAPRIAEPIAGVGRALLGLCSGPLSALVSLTHPLHQVVRFITQYPVLSLPVSREAQSEPSRRTGPRGRPRLRIEFNATNDRFF